MTPIRLPFNERLPAKALWCNNTCFAISLVWPWIMRTFMSLLRTQAAISRAAASELFNPSESSVIG